MEIDSGVLRKRLRQHLNELADHMAGGGCKSWDDYRNAAGKVEGLALAERELLDMIEVRKKAEDEDE